MASNLSSNLDRRWPIFANAQFRCLPEYRDDMIIKSHVPVVVEISFIEIYSSEIGEEREEDNLFFIWYMYINSNLGLGPTPTYKLFKSTRSMGKRLSKHSGSRRSAQRNI